MRAALLWWVGWTALLSCDAGLPTATSPPTPVMASTTAAPPARPPPAPCRCFGSALQGTLVDDAGAPLADVDIEGGTVEAEIGADRTRVRAVRSALTVDGWMQTRGLSLWVAERIDLVADHVWIAPGTRVEIARLDEEGVGVELSSRFGSFEFLRRTLPCRVLSLESEKHRVHEPAPAHRLAGSRLWYEPKAKEVHVRGSNGKTFATWSFPGLQNILPDDVTLEGPAARVRVTDASLVWDVWVSADSFEPLYPRMGRGMYDGGRDPMSDVGDQSGPLRPRPPPPRRARVKIASRPRVGDAPATARELEGVVLGPDIRVTISKEEDGFAAVRLEDRAVTVPRSQLWVKSDTLSPE